MNIGRRIKQLYGVEDSVDYISFMETKEHIVAIVHTYDQKITHKQVNAVLNRYPLGHWIFVESRIEEKEGISFKYNDNVVYTGKQLYLVSIYRVDKKTALAVLE